jgi:hypothetical protein
MNGMREKLSSTAAGRQADKKLAGQSTV